MPFNKGQATPGAGRPKGSRTKLDIRDFMSDDEVRELIDSAKLLAKKGDKEMIKYLLDQNLGKARQNIGLDGGEDNSPIKINISDDDFTKFIGNITRGKKSIHDERI
jgi:hypothetical protein